MIIKDATGSVKSEAVTLMRYFKKGDETVNDFNEQLKALTPEAKTELAVGAAKEMGWSVEN